MQEVKWGCQSFEERGHQVIMARLEGVDQSFENHFVSLSHLQCIELNNTSMSN